MDGSATRICAIRRCRAQQAAARVRRAVRRGDDDMKTALTEQLEIEHPVVSAGMARVSQGDLVAAVSNAGGMGCLGGISYLPGDLDAEIRGIRPRTEKPFAVDLVVAPVFTAGDDEAWAPVRALWGELRPDQRAKLKGVEPMLTPDAVQGQVEVILEERPPVLALTFDVPEWLVREC